MSSDDMYELINQLQEARDQLQDKQLPDELKVLKWYILKNWKTCERMRSKMEWEGTDYFYSGYACPPISYTTYEYFVDNDDKCFCDHCGESESDKSESD